MKIPLTPEQIENWRSVLVGQIGPYAYIMPDSEIQLRHDKMQEIADKLAKETNENIT